MSAASLYQAALEIAREMEAAANAGDAAALLARAAPDIVMVSKNGEIVAGREALAAYVERMLGARGMLRGMRSRVRLAGAPLALGEDLGVAHGVSEDHYDFAGGAALEIVTSWSASLVRAGGDWKIARIHFSFDLFDNPLLRGARTAAYGSAAAGFALGLAGGLVLHWLRKRKTTLGRPR